MSRLTDAQRQAAYGAPTDDRPLVLLTTPWGIRVQCHRLVADVFMDACRAAEGDSSWRPRRIDSHVDRYIRDRETWSLHSYGLAWDFFATPPGVEPPGGVWTPDNGVPPAFARPFEARGFTWGARWTRKDVPHIEWAGPPPGRTVEEDDMLKQGDQGPAVRDLQRRLNAYGAADAIDVDGKYGPATATAVAATRKDLNHGAGEDCPVWFYIRLVEQLQRQAIKRVAQRVAARGPGVTEAQLEAEIAAAVDQLDVVRRG